MLLQRLLFFLRQFLALRRAALEVENVHILLREPDVVLRRLDEPGKPGLVEIQHRVAYCTGGGDHARPLAQLAPRRVRDALVRRRSVLLHYVVEGVDRLRDREIARLRRLFGHRRGNGVCGRQRFAGLGRGDFPVEIPCLAVEVVLLIRIPFILRNLFGGTPLALLVERRSLRRLALRSLLLPRRRSFRRDGVLHPRYAAVERVELRSELALGVILERLLELVEPVAQFARPVRLHGVVFVHERFGVAEHRFEPVGETLRFPTLAGRGFVLQERVKRGGAAQVLVRKSAGLFVRQPLGHVLEVLGHVLDKRAVVERTNRVERPLFVGDFLALVVQHSDHDVGGDRHVALVLRRGFVVARVGLMLLGVAS